jgi:adenosyl cobinamide kinase/adenosyl cobinamide phosphate guanylyltransferase
MIDKLESDIANKNIDHISVECINALINGCCNNAQDAESYEKVKEAKDNIDKLNWLKKRFLWAKISNDVVIVANEIITYLPDDKRALAWKIDDLYMAFMVDSNFNFDGNYIHEEVVKL